jgi:ABC-type transporter Mla MlaB component
VCELCTVPRPPGPARPGIPADDDADAPRRPQGMWPSLSGVRGALAVVPLGAAPERRPAPPAGDDGLRLVLRGDLTRQVLAWSEGLTPDVLPRVRVVCTADLTHLDDAGRALLVDLVRVAHRHGRRLHLPTPSPAVTSVLSRLGLLGAVDRGPDPWASPADGRDGGAEGRGPR